MSEPLDDELRAHVDALRAVERPTAAARAATWAVIESRIDPAVVPLRRPRATVTLAAMAAAIALSLGLAAAAAWRARADEHVEAMDQPAAPPDPIPLAPRPSELGATIHAPAPPEPPPTATISGPDLTPALPEPPEPTTTISGPDHASPGQALPTATIPEPAPSVRSPRPESSVRRKPPIADTPSLSPEEVASFQRAQAALADGRPDDALRLLDEHGRRFPGGVFEEERLVSRATALCKLGDVEAARAARRRFLRDLPASHLAERMRQICREIE